MEVRKWERGSEIGGRGSGEVTVEEVDVYVKVGDVEVEVEVWRMGR